MEPLKIHGLLQGLTDISVTRKEVVGSIFMDRRGRKFRYSKAGATALAVGKMCTMAAIDADVINKTAPATAVGTKVLTLTIASATYAADKFAGGYMNVNDAAGEGYSYPISGSSAVAAGTSINIVLEEGIKVALTTSSEFTLVHSPYMGTVLGATVTDVCVGVPLVAVTAAYYYWSQTGGEGICLVGDDTAFGEEMMLGTTDGSLILSTEVATSPVVATMIGLEGVNGEYYPVRLSID